MQLFMYFITLILVVLSLTACGGGNGLAFPDTGNTTVCSETSVPIEKDLEVSDKVSKVTWPEGQGSDPQVPSGNYEYSSMEFYMNDTETTYKLHVAHLKNEAGQFYVERKCVRNAIKSTPFSGVGLSFPSTISISESGKTMIQTKELAIYRSEEGQLFTEFSESSEQQSLPPSKVTGDQNFEAQLYEVIDEEGNPVYEYRMALLDGVVKQYAVIRYQRTE